MCETVGEPRHRVCCHRAKIGREARASELIEALGITALRARLNWTPTPYFNTNTVTPSVGTVFTVCVAGEDCRTWFFWSHGWQKSATVTPPLKKR